MATAISVNRYHHQYAGREERPLNVTYFANASRTASENVMAPFDAAAGTTVITQSG